MLRPDIVLDPRSPIFLIGGIVETALSGAGKGILSSFVHPFYL